MAVEVLKEKWNSKVVEVTLGTGDKTVTLGGESTLPFLTFEGEMPNPPRFALEVFDTPPTDWPDILVEPFKDVINDPVAWAKKCVEYGADIVALRLVSAHPDGQNRSGAELAEVCKAVADAIDVPLMIIGCGVEEKDAEIFPVIGEALSGRNCLLSSATKDNYKPIVATCMVHGHSVVASAPLDINLSKQLNIMIMEMNLAPNRIIMDPLIGALGYGIEYSYSIIERMRLGALTGDKILAMPVVCFIGQEAWKAKEAKDPDVAEWGDYALRAIHWETVTTVALIQAGGHLFVMRHPKSLAEVKEHLKRISK